jgi:hypothetical protein
VAGDGERGAPPEKPEHPPETPEGETSGVLAAEPAGAPSSEEHESVALPVPTADTLQRYLTEIRRIPVLSREEEHALAVRWREHDDRAAGIRLVTSNLRLVVLIAREYERAVQNLLDLIQEETSASSKRSRTSIPIVASAFRRTRSGGCARTSSVTS